MDDREQARLMEALRFAAHYARQCDIAGIPHPDTNGLAAVLELAVFYMERTGARVANAATARRTQPEQWTQPRTHGKPLRGLFFLVLRKKSKRIVNESQTVKERM